MRKEQYATKLFKFKDNLLTVYQKKCKKNTLLLSSLHTEGIKADNPNKTPETVKCFNKTKCKLDVVDQMAYRRSAGQ